MPATVDPTQPPDDDPSTPDRSRRPRASTLAGGLVAIALLALVVAGVQAHTGSPWNDLDVLDPTTPDGAALAAGCGDPQITVEHRGWRSVAVSWTDCCNDYHTTFDRSWRGWSQGSTWGTLVGCIDGV